MNGLDLVSLDSYLQHNGIPRSGELRAELISGGRSNLTFKVHDDQSEWILRRPPLHGLTPSAHDMAREYKVVAALGGTPVPVAPVVTLCEDESVLGAPFAIVDYVDGQVVRTRWRSSRPAWTSAIGLPRAALSPTGRARWSRRSSQPGSG